MELANKKIKNAYFGGSHAKLNQESLVSDFNSVAKIFGSELRNDSQKSINPILARQTKGMSY